MDEVVDFGPGIDRLRVGDPVRITGADRAGRRPVPQAGHWIAEENPAALVEIVTRFDRTTREH